MSRVFWLGVGITAGYVVRWAFAPTQTPQVIFVGSVESMLSSLLSAQSDPLTNAEEMASAIKGES